jgi:hypothetical protein
LSDRLGSWESEIESLKALLAQIQARYSVDPKRVYLTGLSIGGAGIGVGCNTTPCLDCSFAKVLIAEDNSESARSLLLLLFCKALANFRRNLVIRHLVNCFNTYDAFA